MKNIIYKIRHKDTGLFSRGGTSLNSLWNEKGKAWTNIGHLKNHFIQLSRYNRDKDNPYKNAEIIEISIDYDSCPKMDAAIVFEEIEKQRKLENDRIKEMMKRYREKQERQQLEELKRKYESEIKG